MDLLHIILVFLVILLTQCSNHVVRCVITDVRLFGGPPSNKGTVEVRQDNGTWETTCGVNLGINDVIVICRQLGFTGPSRAIVNTPYGRNSIPTTGLGCNGDEADLSKCTLFPIGCSTAGAASCHGKDYLGCFVDLQNDRVLPGDKLIADPDMTISYCIQFCNESTTANYTYAGVGNGIECYCGEASDKYSRHGVGSDYDCLSSCSGDPTESCGGSGYIAIFTIHVETSGTTPVVVSTEKVNEVTSQPSSEMTSYTKDAVTSSPMTTPLSKPTTLPQSGHGSCVGVGVGEGVVIILLIATIISMVILQNRRKKKDCALGHNTHDMTLVKASSLHDKDTGFYHDIQDVRTPVPSSTPAGDAQYSSKIFDQKRGYDTAFADTGIPKESTQYSTRIEKDGLATDTMAMKKKETGNDADPYIEMI